MWESQMASRSSERSTIIVLSKESANASDKFKIWDGDLGGDAMGFVAGISVGEDVGDLFAFNELCGKLWKF
eukprot:2675439-Ditylum_brightwellii.AAC.1